MTATFLALLIASPVPPSQGGAWQPFLAPALVVEAEEGSEPKEAAADEGRPSPEAPPEAPSHPLPPNLGPAQVQPQR